MRRWRSKAQLGKALDPDTIIVLTENRIEYLTRKYLDACENCDYEKANLYHQGLKYHHGVKTLLQREATGNLPRHTLTYRFSSMHLNDVNRLLIDGSGNENECYCAGILDKENNIAISIQILPIKLARQSIVFARGDASSIYHTLSELDRWAHPILMFCHSHPGRGPDSTRPSGTDLGTHRDLEVSYQAIGAIFSQDGCVRFFSAGKEFQVEVFGKGVVKVDDNVYRIQG